MEVMTWEGCYSEGWKGLITSESFAHPAKMAYGLLTRIIRFGLEQKFWREGDLIGDCFGGIGTTGIVGAYHGLRVVSVELEPRFHKMAEENYTLHRHKWQTLGVPMPVMVQGDSRRFAEIVREAGGVVTSPPYAETGMEFVGKRNWERCKEQGIKPSGGLNRKNKPNSLTEGYGEADGQIGRLREGDLDAAITSPPYADSVHDGNGIDQSKLTGNKPGKNTQANAEGYGSEAGQIGRLKEGEIEGVVTSPPWEDQEPSHAQNDTPSKRRMNAHALSGRTALNSEYGKADGQIGTTQGETYWSAMKAVYSSMRDAMKPGAVASIVLKSYVKKGKIVDLPSQTVQLLEHLGFKVFLRVHAMLVKEESHAGLFGKVTKKTERKSFFRRLAESKGSPAIDFEEVLFARR